MPISAAPSASFDQTLTKARALVNEALRESLYAERVVEAFEALDDHVLEDFRAFVMGSGKRFRAVLVLVGWRQFGGDPALDHIALDVGVALEMFHTFLLIHDDVIDRSELRRGDATLRQRFKERYAHTKHGGESLADHMSIVVGDICFTLAMEQLNSLDIDPKQSRNIMRAMLRYARETGVGQVLDVVHGISPLGAVDEEQVLKCYDLKTGRYTIECPLVLGALLAGADPIALAGLEKYARSLGVAYQLNDDLIGVSRERDEKRGTSDFEQGRQTVLLALTLENAEPADKIWLTKHFGSGSLSQQHAQHLMSLYTSTGAVDEVERRITHHRQKALRAVSSLPDLQSNGQLESLVSKLVP